MKTLALESEGLWDARRCYLLGLYISRFASFISMVRIGRLFQTIYKKEQEESGVPLSAVMYGSLCLLIGQ